MWRAQNYRQLAIGLLLAFSWGSRIGDCVVLATEVKGQLRNIFKMMGFLEKWNVEAGVHDQR